TESFATVVPERRGRKAEIDAVEGSAPCEPGPVASLESDERRQMHARFAPSCRLRTVGPACGKGLGYELRAHDELAAILLGHSAQRGKLHPAVVRVADHRMLEEVDAARLGRQ